MSINDVKSTEQKAWDKTDKSRKVCCSVCNCSYHAGDDVCTADSINVGPQHACNIQDTVCATFKSNGKNTK